MAVSVLRWAIYRFSGTDDRCNWIPVNRAPSFKSVSDVCEREIRYRQTAHLSRHNVDLN